MTDQARIAELSAKIVRLEDNLCLVGGRWDTTLKRDKKRITELEAIIVGKRQFIEEFQAHITKLEAELKQVHARMGWTVEDNAKKAIELADVRAELKAAQIEAGRYKTERDSLSRETCGLCNMLERADCANERNELEAELKAARERGDSLRVAFDNRVARLDKARERIADLQDPGWLDFMQLTKAFLSHYPDTVFDGSSSDSGPVFVVKLREAYAAIPAQEKPI